jgi:hypothetical protein
VYKKNIEDMVKINFILGIASAILQKTISDLENIYSKIHIYKLHCKIDNEIAINFYQKQNFKIKERITSYYFINNKEEDAYVLSLERNYSLDVKKKRCNDLFFQCLYNFFFSFILGKRKYTIIDEDSKLL